MNGGGRGGRAEKLSRAVRRVDLDFDFWLYYVGSVVRTHLIQNAVTEDQQVQVGYLLLTLDELDAFDAPLAEPARSAPTEQLTFDGVGV